MLEAVYERSFEKEVKLAKKRGLDLLKLKKIMELLINENPLPDKYRNHKLKGNFNGYWECHITPDWLLIYKKTETTIFFVRTGSHSDLF